MSSVTEGERNQNKYTFKKLDSTVGQIAMKFSTDSHVPLRMLAVGQEVEWVVH